METQGEVQSAGPSSEMLMPCPFLVLFRDAMSSRSALYIAVLKSGLLVTTTISVFARSCNAR